MYILMFALSTPVISWMNLFILSCSFDPGFAQPARPLSLLKASYTMGSSYSRLGSRLLWGRELGCCRWFCQFPTYGFALIFYVVLLSNLTADGPEASIPLSSREAAEVAPDTRGLMRTPCSSLQPLLQAALTPRGCSRLTWGRWVLPPLLAVTCESIPVGRIEPSLPLSSGDGFLLVLPQQQTGNKPFRNKRPSVSGWTRPTKCLRWNGNNTETDGNLHTTSMK